MQYNGIEETRVFLQTKQRGNMWWLNLQAHPSAKVQVGKKTIAVTATSADAEERARLWSLVTSRYPDFADYQRRTTREIPVVILTPAV